MRPLSVTAANAFWGELEKVARVPKAVKQYRRVMEALKTEDSLFHGTKPKHVGSILKGRQLDPAPGTHGTGVYMWKGKPRSTYMRYPHSERYPLGFPGVFAKKTDLKLGKEPHDPRPYGSSMHQGTFSERPFMAISEDPVKLPPKSSIVADARQLREFREDIKKGRFRQVDSRILHRVEADLQMKLLDKIHGTDHYRPPTKKELSRLIRSEKPMPYVGMVRDAPRTDDALNKLYGSYDEMLGREVSRDAQGNYEYF